MTLFQIARLIFDFLTAIMNVCIALHFARNTPILFWMLMVMSGILLFSVVLRVCLWKYGKKEEAATTITDDHDARPK